MNPPVIIISDTNFPTTDEEQRVAEAAGIRLESAGCETPGDIIARASHADALLNQYVRIDRDVLKALSRCKAIVRYGVGVDNVDVEAAAELNIPVCNVPDYGMGEVAEHALAMALALNRRLPMYDRDIRSGIWEAATLAHMQPIEESTVGTLGFGRIARTFHAKLKGLGRRRIAFDPFVEDNVFEQVGVERVELNAVLEQSDILSLHLSLNKETHHILNEARLNQMKPTALIINTSRGALIDNYAMAKALQEGRIGAAGLDVLEEEPPPPDHPIRQAPNTLLSPHAAYYSSSSIARLQRLAAEEAVRAVRGEPLRCRVN